MGLLKPFSQSSSFSRLKNPEYVEVEWEIEIRTISCRLSGKLDVAKYNDLCKVTKFKNEGTSEPRGWEVHIPCRAHTAHFALSDTSSVERWEIQFIPTTTVMCAKSFECVMSSGAGYIFHNPLVPLYCWVK